ncbi:MAG TPA: hypothetical protein VE569_09005, partial [Acidimicrobiia bacterium]|nr:hypothetical protein [Acidimicrobiia bacterium]
MRRRLIWFLLVVAGVLYLAAVAWAISAGFTGFSILFWYFVLVPAIASAGAVMMARRPQNPTGELFLVFAIATLVLPEVVGTPAVVVFERSGPRTWMWIPMWASMTLTGVGIIFLMAALMLLPDGRFRYKRERALLKASSIMVVLPTLALVSNQFVLAPSQAFPGMDNIPSPIVVHWLVPFGGLTSALGQGSYLLILVAVVFLFLRYRHASLRHRKQIRWVLFGGGTLVFLAVVALVFQLLGLMSPPAHDSWQ